MKKLMFISIFILFLVYPFSVYADFPDIESVSIDGGNSFNIGDELYQDILVKFYSISPKSRGIGIAGVIYEVDYDKEVLSLEEVISNNWDSYMQVEDGAMHVVSAINGNYDEKCMDEVLYCGDYKVTLKFHVKETSEESTKISIKEVTAIGYNISINYDYKEDNARLLTYNNVSTKTLYITKKSEEGIDNQIQDAKVEEVVESKKEEIKVEEKKEETQKPKTSNNSNNSNNNVTIPKSTNAKLSSLVIEGYEMSFSKDVDNYEIVINNDVNMVNIIANSEDAKSKVEVYGNDNLKENDYKVLVKVTSESGSTKTYTIKFKIDDNSENVIVPLEENTKEEIKKEEKEENQDSKSKIIKIGIFALIILILSIVISKIIYNKILDSKVVI